MEAKILLGDTNICGRMLDWMDLEESEKELDREYSQKFFFFVFN